MFWAGAFGGSSGGHLVALLGTTSAAQPAENRVQAVCDFYGPTDLLTMPPNTLGYGRDIGRVRTQEDIATSNGAGMLGARKQPQPPVLRRTHPLAQKQRGGHWPHPSYAERAELA